MARHGQACNIPCGGLADEAPSGLEMAFSWRVIMGGTQQTSGSRLGHEVALYWLLDTTSTPTAGNFGKGLSADLMDPSL